MVICDHICDFFIHQVDFLLTNFLYTFRESTNKDKSTEYIDKVAYSQEQEGGFQFEGCEICKWWCS